MTDDLVKRLRGRYVIDYDEKNQIALCDEAADRIEKLEAALREIAGNGNATGCNPQIMCDIARKALEGSNG